MRGNIHAYTAPGSTYPEYISVNETDDPDLSTITIHSKPEVRDGEFVCGYARDKGKPGRCTPGDEHCNNYCNSAPEKGSMADHPMSTEHVEPGETAIIALTRDQLAQLAAAIFDARDGAAD